MLSSESKINNPKHRIVMAAVGQNACICYDGPGVSVGQIDPITGENVSLVIFEQCRGKAGCRMSCQAFNLNAHQAYELLSCCADLVDEPIEEAIPLTQQERDFAMSYVFTFRSRNLNAKQASILVCKHAGL